MIEQQSTVDDIDWPLTTVAGNIHRNSLLSVPPAPTCEICVVIPARDEQDTLDATLTALARQVDLSGQLLDPARYEIIVLANNCSDRSAAVAREVAARQPDIALHIVEIQLPEPEAHVGMARRLLMDEAYRRLLSLDKPRGIIATTDADTLASPDWVAQTIAEIGRGADAVGGRIVANPRELRTLNKAGRACHIRDVGYRSLVAELEARLDPDIYDPWPRHFQHFGASLAVTASTYQRAGRLPVKPWFEDVAFYDALMRIDARFRHSPQVQVTTSGRRTGRTGFGFAVQLTQWENTDQCDDPMCVESVRAVEARMSARRNLRQTWRMHRCGLSLNTDWYHSVCAELEIDPIQLREALDQYPAFGLLLEQVTHARRESGRQRASWPLVDVRDAIPDLRRRLAELRGSSSGVLLEEIQPVQPAALSSQMQ